MRTAAGVLLIIAAVFNLVAGLTYLGGGALTQGVSEAAIYAEKESGEQMTAEQKAAIDKVQEQVGGSGIGFMAFGIFLLVSVGILIAGAVFLFQNKKAQFIMIAGGMAILAELIGSYISGFGLLKIIGLVGGIMAVLAAKGMGAGSAPEPDDATE
jgi:hypothetical protein